MVMDMNGSKLKNLPKLYSVDESKNLFDSLKFVLFEEDVVSEGQLVDLFGVDVVGWLDHIYNIQWTYKEKTARVQHHSSGYEDATFRAVSLRGFFDVVSYHNAKMIEDYYSKTPGGSVAAEKWQEAVNKRKAKSKQADDKLAREKAKQHEYYLKRKAKKEQEKQG